ncbi:DeoR/GlpR family DNA-binding transcription regulator [Caldibacillus lycopersici]|uniref:DeoR/GlpR family DNA-binding transcription regulator n=1 Tax=Perspicuibacillus lycopersici TaxID=1325689 RepID=A0AAE3IQX7_9BACI|nr:DeoR/GlpR family DNA-binding transcription regulator [Perspicuibacillus lycopersici]MCU9612938.1 DeoR/GlpR family DNA-binding transcription regulator [Perspicuibacillus lycopersici]
MLTVERHNKILEQLKVKDAVTIQELVELTASSESTIRRDLLVLEEAKHLKRIHGGAARLRGMLAEPNLQEKTEKNREEKLAIAKVAASFVHPGDCIFLDAGTTTLAMIEFFQEGQNMVVVTNGFAQIDALIKKGIRSYIIGGLVKPTTGAVIGSSAVQSMEQYRFDKCFLGVNGIHPTFGYTTPDTEESSIKQQALRLAKQGYVLADHTKFNEISFAKIAELDEATIITDELDTALEAELMKITNVKVVK